MYIAPYRSAGYIRRLFWLHSIWLAGVINQAQYNREVRVRSTKYPPQFGIDLLIDDSEGGHMEGERHGFAMLIISPAAAEWVAEVKARL